MALEDDIKTINASIKDVGDRLKTHAEAAAKNAELSTETRAKVDELLTEQGKLQANLQNTQQALAKLEANGAGGDVQYESVGQKFVRSEKFKAFASQTTPRGRVDMPIHAAITSLTTDADGSAGDLVRPTPLVAQLLQLGDAAAAVGAGPRRAHHVADVVAAVRCGRQRVLGGHPVALALDYELRLALPASRSHRGPRHTAGTRARAPNRVM